MAIVQDRTTCGIILRNTDWTADFLTYIAERQRVDGFTWTYEQKNLEWLTNWANPVTGGNQTLIYKVGTPLNLINAGLNYQQSVANGSTLTLPAGKMVQGVKIDQFNAEPIAGGYSVSGNTLTLPDGTQDANVYITVS